MSGPSRSDRALTHGTSCVEGQTFDADKTTLFSDDAAKCIGTGAPHTVADSLSTRGRADERAGIDRTAIRTIARRLPGEEVVP